MVRVESENHSPSCQGNLLQRPSLNLNQGQVHARLTSATRLCLGFATNTLCNCAYKCHLLVTAYPVVFGDELREASMYWFSS